MSGEIKIPLVKAQILANSAAHSSIKYAGRQEWNRHLGMCEDVLRAAETDSEIRKELRSTSAIPCGVLKDTKATDREQIILEYRNYLRSLLNPQKEPPPRERASG